MFSYFSKNALQFTKLILKLAEFSNTAGSKVASRSPTIGWEWTPHVLQYRRRCREQSLLLRSWSQVQLDQAVCHVCHGFPGDIVDISARLHLKVNLERAQTASHRCAGACPPSLTRFFLQEVIFLIPCAGHFPSYGNSCSLPSLTTCTGRLAISGCLQGDFL